MYMHCYAFSICQLPSCNLFTQHVIYLLWRDTTSDPGPLFYIDITTYCKHCSLSFSANKHHFPHYTSNPLFSAIPMRLTTSLFRGAKYLGCVVCRFHVAAEPDSAPCQHQLSTTFRSDFFLLLVRLNLGFLLRENLLLYSSYLSLGDRKSVV